MLLILLGRSLVRDYAKLLKLNSIEYKWIYDASIKNGFMILLISVIKNNIQLWERRYWVSFTNKKMSLEIFR